MKTQIAICLILLTGIVHARKKVEVPYRLDIQVLGGVAKTWNDLWPKDQLSYVAILQGKGLVEGKKVRKKVAKKYRKLVGDEVYTGHLLLPRMFMGRYQKDFRHFYVDWQPLSLGLLSIPNKMTLHAPANLRLSASLVLAYQYLGIVERDWHSVRPGLSLELEFRQKLNDSFSLVFLGFQKGFLPDERMRYGTKENIFHHPSGVSVGLIFHSQSKTKM
jgi:hypothetical protein